MKKLNSKAGFSLVELMVVVAIIGVLAAIAVPNYQRFQAKAKASEAKGALAAIYTAEKSYYIEKDQYSADLTLVGYAPEGGLKFYNVGFQAGTVNQHYFVCNNSGGANSCQIAAGAPAGAVNPAGVNFTAAAAADLDGDAVQDVWTINATRVLSQTTQD